ELSVLQRQCLDRRIPDDDTLKSEIAAWEHQRNAEQATIDWRFSVTDARKKLERLYPSLPARWGTSTAKTLFFIHTLTGLQPGSGTALGVVDLPVQRERHTQWPLIPGSSLKGILRDACRESIKDSYRDATQQQNGISDNSRRSPRQRANEEDNALV